MVRSCACLLLSEKSRALPSLTSSGTAGRFSIAGGAFKSLLICGTEPNDIDVWVRHHPHRLSARLMRAYQQPRETSPLVRSIALLRSRIRLISLRLVYLRASPSLQPASEEDRVAFIFAINQQQQQRQADTSVAAAGSPPRRVSIEENKPYNTIIRSPTLPCPLEVTFKVGRLESILPSFDICLAVVGAEFEGRRVLRVVVDEGAQRSVDQGQILLVRGYDALPPTRKVLNTIHRMRRYAAETGLASMPAEEGRAWALFEAADPAIQQRMLSDLRVFAKGGGAGSSVQALGEEAERRLLALVDQQRKQ